MSICLRRREFIAALGSAAVWPLAAHAQRPAMPVIGYLTNYGTGAANERQLAAFRKGLMKRAISRVAMLRSSIAGLRIKMTGYPLCCAI
jgi:hypothetical protein